MRYLSDNNRSFRSLLFGTCLILSVFFSCDDQDSREIEEHFILSEITITETMNPLPLLLGRDTVLTYTASPEYATDQSVVWSSQDETIAMVDENGRVTAHKLGSTNIICSSQIGYAASATISIKVIERIIYTTSLTITNTDLEVHATDKIQLNTVATPADITYYTLKWTSEDESIATVDNNGLVTGVKVGSTKITATTTDGTNISHSVTITVKPVIPVVDIILDESLLELAMYQNVVFTPTVLPAEATASSLEWTSSDLSIIKLDNGILTAVNTGSATLTASASYDDGTSIRKSFTIIVPEGKINDVFNEYNNLWEPFKEQALLTVEDNKLIVTSVLDNAPHYKARFKRSVNTYFHSINYPIVAIKLRYNGIVTDEGPNYQVDVWGGDITGGKYGTNASPNNNMPTIITTDGCVVHYFDANPNTGLNFDGYPMSEGVNRLENVIYELWKMSSADGQAPTLEVYWVKSFPTISDLNKYLESE